MGGGSATPSSPRRPGWWGTAEHRAQGGRYGVRSGANRGPAAGGSGVRSCSKPSAQCPAGCGEPLGAGVLIFGSGKWDSRGRVWLTRLSQGGDVTWADGLVTDKAGGADAKGRGSPVTEGGGEAGGHSRRSRSGALTGGPEQTTGTVGHQDGGRCGSPERGCPLQLRGRGPAAGAQKGGPGPLTRGAENPVRGTSALWAGGRRKLCRVRGQGRGCGRSRPSGRRTGLGGGERGRGGGRGQLPGG